MKPPHQGAETLLALARGFMESRIFLTAAELDLFTLLARKGLTATEVTAQVRGDARAVAILLDALAAMGLLRKTRQRYRCPPGLVPLLASDSPDSIRPMVLHSASMWERWAELTGLVRGDEAARARAYAPRGADRMRAFIGAMHVVARARAPEIVRQIKPDRARALLDIGGASGTFLIEFLRAVPQMRATLFDLPGPIELARERLAEAGVLDRVTLVAGDFYADELPGGHDLALLSAIIHQNSPAQNLDLYRKTWRALAPGGRLVIRDHVVSPDRTAPRGGAIFAVNMLCGTPGGNVCTFKEIRDGLVEAGFVRARLLQKGDDRMNGLVEAFRPR
jgi:SAM-dependent methyltransferase